MKVGRTDLCLETSDFETAEENLAMQDERTKRFGSRAFNRRFGKLFPLFLKKKKREVRSRTYELYEGIWLKHFEKFFGKMLLADITQKRWSKFCEQAIGVSDFQNYRNLIHAFLKWCEREQYINAVPTFENPSHKRRKRRIVPSKHLVLIFQFASGSLLLFIAHALFMGMRRREIMTLEWLRIDLESRDLTLRDLDVKTDEGRQVPLTDIVFELLAARLKAQQDAKIKSPWVFPHKTNPKAHANVSGLKTAWRTCLTRAELLESDGSLMYTWHDLRATYETQSHKSTEYTDTQKEKMVGADIDVQKRIYVSMTANDLRGLEEIVSKQLPELVQIIAGKTSALKGPVVKPAGRASRIKQVGGGK